MRWLLLFALAGGCATVRPAVGTGKATMTVETFRRPDRPTFWIVTVDNPTDEPVYIDCEELRIPISPGKRIPVRLDGDDQDCDVMNVDIVAARPPARQHFWLKRYRSRLSP